MGSIMLQSSSHIHPMISETRIDLGGATEPVQFLFNQSIDLVLEDVKSYEKRAIQNTQNV